jgi:hypothetical protein
VSQLTADPAASDITQTSAADADESQAARLGHDDGVELTAGQYQTTSTASTSAASAASSGIVRPDHRLQAGNSRRARGRQRSRGRPPQRRQSATEQARENRVVISVTDITTENRRGWPGGGRRSRIPATRLRACRAASSCSGRLGLCSSGPPPTAMDWLPAFMEVLNDPDGFLQEPSVVVPWKRHSGKRGIISSVG